MCNISGWLQTRAGAALIGRRAALVLPGPCPHLPGQYAMAEWLPTSRAPCCGLSWPVLPGSLPIAMAPDTPGRAALCIEAVDISQRAFGHSMPCTATMRFGRKTWHFGNAIEPHVEGYRVHDRIRNLVTFLQGNLLDERLLAGQAPYQAIFCRNALIYFDAAARRRALQVLDRLLMPGGILFVGYAEMGLFLMSGYVPVRYPRAFAYRKPDAPPDQQSPTQRLSLGRCPHRVASDTGRLFHICHSSPLTRRCLLPCHQNRPRPLNGARSRPAVGQTGGEMDAATTLARRLCVPTVRNAQAYVPPGTAASGGGGLSAGRRLFPPRRVSADQER